MGLRTARRSWRHREIKTSEGTVFHCFFSPDWNTQYFTSRWDNNPKHRIIGVLEEVHTRKPDEIWWTIKGDQIYIGNNGDRDELFHDPNRYNLNELVYDVLRNGRRKPQEVWHT